MERKKLTNIIGLVVLAAFVVAVVIAGAHLESWPNTQPGLRKHYIGDDQLVQVRKWTSDQHLTLLS